MRCVGRLTLRETYAGGEGVVLTLNYLTKKVEGLDKKSIKQLV